MIDCYIQNLNDSMASMAIGGRIVHTQWTPAIKQGRKTVLLGRKEKELRMTSKRKCSLLNTLFLCVLEWLTVLHSPAHEMYLC